MTVAETEAHFPESDPTRDSSAIEDVADELEQVIEVAALDFYPVDAAALRRAIEILRGLL